MLKLNLFIIMSLMISTTCFAEGGLISIKSKHSVNDTTQNLLNALEQKGMTIFATINHQQGAKKVEKELRATTVVIFGNPKIGTPLMQCAQSIAIDLPQKALIWEDKEGQVWYSYNDPQYLSKRHNMVGCEKVLTKVTNALANFANAATKE